MRRDSAHRRDADIQGWCESCGKVTHLSRKAAKRFMRRTPHTGRHPNVYACPADAQFFHIGNLTPGVIAGRVSRDHAYRGIRDTQGDQPMTSVVAYSTETQDPPSTNGHRLIGGPTLNGRPGDTTTAQIDILFTDLTTYRYHPQVPVTPAMADRLIGLNAANNRNYQESRGRNYRRDMVNGDWREKTGQTIKISTDGTLLDGVHRMHAVRDSGVTIVFDLCFGIDPHDILVMDSHKPRSRADLVRVAGGEDLSRVSPLISRIFAWDRGAYMGPNGATTATPIEVERTYQEYQGLFDAGARRGYDLQRRAIGTAAIGGTAYVLLARIDKEATERFFDMLVSGLFGEDGDTHPIYHLREKLIRRKIQKLTAAEMLAGYIRTWNNHHTGTHTEIDGERLRHRIRVHHLQITRRSPGTVDPLTNANFPQPKKALWLPGDRVDTL